MNSDNNTHSSTSSASSSSTNNNSNSSGNSNASSSPGSPLLSHDNIHQMNNIPKLTEMTKEQVRKLLGTLKHNDMLDIDIVPFEIGKQSKSIN